MLKRAGAEPSLWPLAATRLGSGAVLLAVALLTGALRRPDLPALRLLLLTAALDTAANSLYFLAARTSLLTLAAVLTSLYPASTVVLARLVLRERMTRTQLAGMGLALAGVALIAAG
jgi:drug/metabolite transporter (DMT)-like permease